MYLVFRYHYNVTDTRLAEHVEKGTEDGLYISCVASCSDFWAIIMDAGTNFTSQVYELSQSFLHKVNVKSHSFHYTKESFICHVPQCMVLAYVHENTINFCQKRHTLLPNTSTQL